MSRLFILLFFMYLVGADEPTGDIEKRLKIIREKAEQGDPIGLHALALAYFAGNGVEQDYDEAFDLLNQAIKKGSRKSYALLGQCYEMGYGVKADQNKASTYYIKAANNGDYTSFLKAAHSLEKQQKYKEAITYYIKAANNNDIKAIMYCAELYRYGKENILKKNPKVALNYYLKLAIKGNGNAQYNIAEMYNNGEGVKQDSKKALEYLKIAASNNHFIAQSKIAYCYQHGQGLPKDLITAYKWYKSSSLQGYVPAMIELGKCYLYGTGCKQDFKKAFKLFSDAKLANSNLADFYLAECYFNGWGTTKNIDKAVLLYQKNYANIMINAKAQTRLAECYLNGYSVIKNVPKAIEYYQKSAIFIPQNYYILSTIYLKQENDVEKNFKLALKSLQQGAILNNLKSVKFLANFYFQQKEYKQALNYYNQALLLDDNDSIFKINEIKAILKNQNKK